MLALKIEKEKKKCLSRTEKAVALGEKRGKQDLDKTGQGTNWTTSVQ